MVLAHRAHRDVLDQHQLVVVLGVGEGGEVERGHGEHLGERGGHPARRVGERLLLQGQAECAQQVGRGPLGCDQVHRVLVVHDARAPGGLGGPAGRAGELVLRLVLRLGQWRLAHRPPPGADVDSKRE